MITSAQVAARRGGALAAIAALAWIAATAAGALAATGESTAAAAEAAPVAPQVVRRGEVEERLGAPSEGPAATHEVARGAQASVNYWQIEVEMPAHLHRSHEEIIVVQSGTVETTIGDRRVVLGPGDVVLVPRDTVHAGRRIGSAPARGYSVFAPAFDGRDRVPAPPATAP